MFEIKVMPTKTKKYSHNDYSMLVLISEKKNFDSTYSKLENWTPYPKDRLHMMAVKWSNTLALRSPKNIPSIMWTKQNILVQNVSVDKTCEQKNV